MERKKLLIRPQACYWLLTQSEDHSVRSRLTFEKPTGKDEHKVKRTIQMVPEGLGLKKKKMNSCWVRVGQKSVIR